MNAAYLHITLVHLPLLFIPLGFVLGLIALARKNTTLRTTALWLFILSAFVLYIAFTYGEGAEDIISNTSGAVEAAVEPHEESAETSLWFVVALGVVSVMAIFVVRFKPTLITPTFVAVLFLALVSSILLTLTANKGGQIRHPEAHQQVSGESVLED